MAEKKYSEIKSEIANRKSEADKPKHSPGLIRDMQNLIADVYGKVDNLNERLNKLEP